MVVRIRIHRIISHQSSVISYESVKYRDVLSVENLYKELGNLEHLIPKTDTRAALFFVDAF